MKNYKILMFFLFLVGFSFFIGCEQNETTNTTGIVDVVIENLPDPVYSNNQISIPVLVKNNGDSNIPNFNILLIGSGFVEQKTLEIKDILPKSQKIGFIETVGFKSEFLEDISNSKVLQFEYYYPYDGFSQLIFCVEDPSSSYDPNKKPICKASDPVKIYSKKSHVFLQNAKVEIQTKKNLILTLSFSKNTEDTLYPATTVNELLSYLKNRNFGGLEGIYLNITSNFIDLEKSRCYFINQFGSESSSLLFESSKIKTLQLFFHNKNIELKCNLIIKDQYVTQLTSPPYSVNIVLEMEYSYYVMGKVSKQLTIIKQ
ncbi:MAG: hypothetical protein QXR30_02445 [Candidatus Woesearchaeota archaeon]